MLSTLRRLISKNPFRALAGSDRQVFFVCLGAAFIFWLILNLSRTYSITKEVQLDYKVDPDRTLVGEVPRSVPVTISGPGWNLIWESVSGDEIPVTIELAEEAQFLLTNNQLSREVSRRLSSGGLQVANLNYEAKSLLTTPREGKRVPLVSRVELSYAPGYGPADTLQLQPDSITVSGAIDLIDDIEYWTTREVAISGIDADLNASIPLTEAASGVDISYESITAVQQVEAYIQDSLSVPITIVNAPTADSARIFPSQVTIEFTVAQRDYGRLTPGDFQVEADLSQMQSNYGQNLVPLLLKRQPAKVRSVHFQPRAAEYYIYRGVE